MTVKELIEKLQSLPDQDAEVMFAYNYGDYWKNKVAHGIRTVTDCRVLWSAYHDMYRLPNDCDDDIDDAKDSKDVIILR